MWSSRPLAGDGPMTLWLVPVGRRRPSAARGVRRSRAAGQPLGAGRRRRASRSPARRHARRRRRRAGPRPGRGPALVPGPERRLQRRAHGGGDRRDRRPPGLDPPGAPRPDAGRAAARPGRPRPDAHRHRPGGRPARPTRWPPWRPDARTPCCGCSRSRRPPARRPSR